MRPYLAMGSLSQLRHRQRDASPRAVLVIVCAGVVLASLDLFIVNVALPDMAADFHTTGIGGLSWVLNAYAIVYASLLVLFARLAEGRAREIGFLVGVAVFTVASAACALAQSLEVLVAMRVVQAAGAALLTPTSLGLVLATARPIDVRARSARGLPLAGWPPRWARWPAVCSSPPAGAGSFSSTFPSACSHWRSAGVVFRTCPAKRDGLWTLPGPRC